MIQKHWRLDVCNAADMNRNVMILADSRQKFGMVDLLLAGIDYTETYRTKLVRMTPDEARFLASILTKAAEAADLVVE